MRRALISCGLAAALAGCEREQPQTVRGGPGGAAPESPLVVTALQPGPPRPEWDLANPYAEDDAAIAEGKRLYTWFNCAGCHGANGGGGMGPPFADGEWIYGGAPENIFASIDQGRPDGMPAFGDLMPDDQIWKLAAYLHTLAPPDTTAGRRGAGRR